MRRKFFITSLALCTLVLLSATAAANEEVPMCRRADEKVVGDMVKYSLHADANGPVYFTGIGCAIKFRNKELCAMEMLSFDVTGKVFDYQSGTEIDIDKAYFWFDEKDTDSPVLAFSSKESAEQYCADNKHGIILDYKSLTEKQKLK